MLRLERRLHVRVPGVQSHAMIRYLLVVLLLATAASARDRAADERAIRQIIADNTAAFNARDPKALAAHLADDADHINVAGAWSKSRADFERALVDYFKSPTRPTTSDAVERVRFLGKEAAVAIVRRTYRSDKGVRTSVATYVFQRTSGTWKIVTFQNTYEQAPTP